MKKNLSKLKEVPLREVWGHEASDFSQWLSQQENLDFLGEEIGVEIKLVQTEASVGRYNVDILAEDEGSNKKIIIENQLEDTNHDHLGKIITYASGVDASIIIWVVKDYMEEHRKAIDWLNEHMDGTINFFLIKIELWQIENSNPAPKFEVIVSPNEWANAMKISPASSELSKIKLQQLDFWTKFKNYVQSKDSKMRLRTPAPQHWYSVSMGTSGAHISLLVNSDNNLLGCEIYIHGNKELFKFLQQRQEDIEKEIGEKAEWIDARIDSRIVIRKEVSDIFDVNQLTDYFNWLYDKAVLFQNVFSRHLKEFSK